MVKFTEVEIQSNYDTVKQSVSSSEKTFEIIRVDDKMENMGKVGEIKIAKTDLPDTPSDKVDIDREIINLSPDLDANAGTFNYKLMVVNHPVTAKNFFILAIRGKNDATKNFLSYNVFLKSLDFTTNLYRSASNSALSASSSASNLFNKMSNTFRRSSILSGPNSASSEVTSHPTSNGRFGNWITGSTRGGKTRRHVKTPKRKRSKKSRKARKTKCRK
jgi:hypothetical protein